MHTIKKEAGENINNLENVGENAQDEEEKMFPH